MIHKSKCVLLLALLVCVALADEENDMKTKQIRVEVENDLPSGHDVTVHCKSKDDDLGVNIVAPNHIYSIGFCI
ncbi:hypothetical protein SAY86_009228 [Trapa natans]|uniref:S-protein homolog n=1 Tax=Trapa natans TaxID=22666 RepID=A0AAN7L1B0_TRANT|nr:hypothetical protein SAY86_009228 [Trapa natans]